MCVVKWTMGEVVFACASMELNRLPCKKLYSFVARYAFKITKCDVYLQRRPCVMYAIKYPKGKKGSSIQIGDDLSNIPKTRKGRFQHSKPVYRSPRRKSGKCALQHIFHDFLLCRKPYSKCFTLEPTLIEH